jgi:anti-sigma factor RsiW
MNNDSSSQIEQYGCARCADIAAYLDGELTAQAENSFERHLTDCEVCSERLNEQKRLLCALDFAFEDEKNFELPKDFVKTVAVRAESDVSALNSREERRRAVVITALLFGAGILFGIASKKLGVFEAAFSQTKVFLGVFWRAFSRQFAGEIVFSASLILLLLIFSLAALSVLLKKHRRA